MLYETKTQIAGEFTYFCVPQVQHLEVGLGAYTPVNVRVVNHTT